MRRPAVLFAASFLAGCLLGFKAPVSPIWSIAGISFCFIAYLLISRRNFLQCRPLYKALPLCAALLLGGMLRSSLSDRGSDVAVEAAAASQKSNYEGIIASDPEWSVRAKGSGFMQFDFVLDSGVSLRTYLQGDLRGRLAYGDLIVVRGRIREGRSGRKYLSGWLNKKQGYSGGYVSSVHRRLYRIRHKAASMLEAGIEDFPEQAGILKALVLGYRNGVARKTRDLFIATGSLHIFAISGLHIGICCSFAVFLLRSLRVPVPRWFPFLAVILIGYTVMTGASSSSIRACIMALVFYGGAFLGRKADVLSALSLSAFLLCLFDPAFLYDAGFVLSFAVAAGICLLGGAMIGRMSSMSEPDPFLPVRTARRSSLMTWIIGASAVSVSAWLVSAPLMLFFFGRLAPSGLLSNIIIVPMAFIIVLSGCCSLLLGNISLIFSDLFNHASLGLILALEGALNIFSKLPFGHFQGIDFSLSKVLIWYAVLGVLTAVFRGFFKPGRNGPYKA